MGENYKIGNYEIATKAYFDALKACNATGEEILKQLDVNGDKKLTEDELMSLEIQDDENTQTNTTTNNATIKS